MSTMSIAAFESLKSLVEIVEEACDLPKTLVEEVLGLAFSASMTTEESEYTRVDLHYFAAGDPTRQSIGVKNRSSANWSVVDFSDSLPADVKSISKLAPSVDGRFSALAIGHENKKLVIRGILDLSPDFLTFKENKWVNVMATPATFSVSILGPGRLVAFKSFRRLAEITPSGIIKRYLDVFTKGAIHDQLLPSKTQVFNDWNLPFGWNDGFARRLWWGSLKRLLNHIQSHGHGGAVLIAPPAEVASQLNVKYRLEYSGVRDGLVKTISSYPDLEPSGQHHLNYHTEANKLYHSESLVSALSRVDGLVHLDETLVCRSFGSMIKGLGAAEDVVVAKSESGDSAEVVPVQSLGGTRHRSMASLIEVCPNAVGIVISQDGSVKAFTGVNGKTTMFNNVEIIRSTNPYLTGTVSIEDLEGV